MDAKNALTSKTLRQLALALGVSSIALGACIAGEEVSPEGDLEETSLSATAVGTTALRDVRTRCTDSSTCGDFALACQILQGNAFSAAGPVNGCGQADTCSWTEGKATCTDMRPDMCGTFIAACKKAKGQLDPEYDPTTHIPKSYSCTCPTC
ncbi:hypothetical protein [Sorangium sp. So ce341]|uniref:hypothetical protein n=1 Tax=Sorangium sp. So ce341 TaxID=3133302 RepID=UPI003F62AB9D